MLCAVQAAEGTGLAEQIRENLHLISKNNILFGENVYNHDLCPPPLRVRVSCGHLCEAEAPTEATAETRST